MYLKRLLVVVLLVVVLGYITGAFFDNRYRERMQYYVFDKMDIATSKKQDFDIIYLGNSRIHSGINPYYVDSVTSLRSYNLAVGACDEEEMKLISTVYLQHHQPPAVAVIGVDNSMLVKYNILKERFPYLFYLKNDTVDYYMNRKGFPTRLIQYMPFFKYSFFDEYNRTAVFVSGKPIPRFEHNIYSGFVNISREAYVDSGSVTRTKPMGPRELPQAEKINDTAAATFKQTIGLLRSKGTRIIFLFPPSRNKKSLKKDEEQPLHRFFLEYAATNSIPVMRADTSSIYSDKYFSDNFHLNEPGSRILSVQVGNFIRSNVEGR